MSRAGFEYLQPDTRLTRLDLGLLRRRLRNGKLIVVILAAHPKHTHHGIPRVALPDGYTVARPLDSSSSYEQCTVRAMIMMMINYKTNACHKWLALIRFIKNDDDKDDDE